LTKKTAPAAAALCAALLALSCSSRPAARGETDDLRRQAEAQLALGNRQADRGSPQTALFFMDEAMRLAVLADDSGLRIRAGLSRANALSSKGLQAEAALEREKALAEALFAGDAELAALARVHAARARLLSGGGPEAARAVLEEVSRERAFLRDGLFEAFAWTVTALAEAELGGYARAEAAARQSLAIHERARRTELAAFDWFMTASFRSRAGDFDGARLALETSIGLDRRAENSWGLASSWRAMGDVESRAGNTEAARAAYLRAAGIFRALGNEAAAQDALSRAGL